MLESFDKLVLYEMEKEVIHLYRIKKDKIFLINGGYDFISIFIFRAVCEGNEKGMIFIREFFHSAGIGDICFYCTAILFFKNHDKSIRSLDEMCLFECFIEFEQVHFKDQLSSGMFCRNSWLVGYFWRSFSNEPRVKLIGEAKRLTEKEALQKINEGVKVLSDFGKSGLVTELVS